ncbi:hypothetical protein JXR93_08305 [bacterium]|nr:hypothetical protein [bacterium]
MNFGAIDLGSNTSFLKIVNSKKETALDKIFYTKTARGLDSKGFITAQKIFELDIFFAEVSELVKEFAPITVVGNATAVYRDAINGFDIISYFAKKYSLELSIIDGVKEAQLSFLGAKPDFIDYNNYFLIDIGGRSTEISFIEKNEITESFSFPFGVVSFDGKTKNHVFDELKKFKFSKKSQTFVGLGGVPTTIGTLEKGLSSFREDLIHLLELSPQQIYKWYDFFNNSSPDDIKHLDILDSRRADVVKSGSMILWAILDFFDAEKIVLSTKSLRDGIIEANYSVETGFSSFF